MLFRSISKELLLSLHVSNDYFKVLASKSDSVFYLCNVANVGCQLQCKLAAKHRVKIVSCMSGDTVENLAQAMENCVFEIIKIMSLCLAGCCMVYQLTSVVRTIEPAEFVSFASKDPSC